MKITTGTFFLILSCVFLSSGLMIHALFYDYSATTECLAEPQRAQYGGGILVNPEFNDGIKGWTAFGRASIREGTSKGGNKFIMAQGRTHALDNFSQKVQLEEGKFYTFSAWIQTSRGSENVGALFKTSKGILVPVGKVVAKSGCWTFLKGGLVANFTGSANILLESENTKAEIWADNMSLQSFTKQEWRLQQERNIEEVRKRKVKFHSTYPNNTSLQGATISIKQTQTNFPFGCGMNHYILTSKAYQNWFTSRFKYTTFTNEMKWYSTEKSPFHEKYTVADEMVKFAKQNGISIRGHNILWDNPKRQPQWVKNISNSKDLLQAVTRRMNSVTSRYREKLIAWDVVNENMHFSFLEDKLGKNASAKFYSEAHKIDPTILMFLNEFNTIEDPQDKAANAIKYKKKIDEILAYPGNKGMPIGIGVQGHFSNNPPNIAYMRSTLDSLGSTGFPVWLTEVDVKQTPNQAKYLEEILREAYSHPAVKGIISFSGPAVAGFKDMPLTDMHFKNTPAGDVVDKLLREWKSGKLETTTDRRGYSPEISLFDGEYYVTINDPTTNSSTSVSLKVAKDHTVRQTIHVNIEV